MARNPPTDWFKLAHDRNRLWAESVVVMRMRSADIMTGRGSDRENRLMVREKVQAAAELAVQLAASSPGFPETSARKAVGHYRRKVAANRKRLSRRTSSW